MSKQHVDVSKFLSFVLRHDPQAIGLTLDSEGWADITLLIAGAHRHGRTLDETLIRAVVDSNDKKRFALSDDGLRIRAVQGHSTETVAIRYTEQQPPALLYHGTTTRFLDSIRAQGLRPGTRHHVHLAADRQTAIAVGKRYGLPVVLIVEAQRLQENGGVFFQAENGVWLTEAVPPGFFREE